MANNKYRTIADNAARSVSNETLRLSFEFLDWSIEAFFIHGLEQELYKKLFRCFDEITNAKESDITEQTHPSLCPKSIFNTSTGTQEGFPEQIVNKLRQQLFLEDRDADAAQSKSEEIISRAFELSVSKNSGRLHGFVWNNTFNVVWFDPAHNLYPGKYGVKGQKQFATVKCFSPDELYGLRAQLDTLQIAYDELFEAFAEYQK